MKYITNIVQLVKDFYGGRTFDNLIDKSKKLLSVSEDDKSRTIVYDGLSEMYQIAAGELQIQREKQNSFWYKFLTMTSSEQMSQRITRLEQNRKDMQEILNTYIEDLK